MENLTTTITGDAMIVDKNIRRKETARPFTPLFKYTAVNVELPNTTRARVQLLQTTAHTTHSPNHILV